MKLPEAEEITTFVAACLAEDIGDGDITAALTPADQRIAARIVSREPGVLCGAAWADEVFRQLDDRIEVRWESGDGERFDAGDILCRINGAARGVLTGERTALNILQTLSSTASITRAYVDRIAHTRTRLLDTRKTLPGMRNAQKYAVRCGGGHNHRIGLYDGILIKENHLRSGRGIAKLLAEARRNAPPGVFIEIEAESLDELAEALECDAQRVLLDNFDLDELREAVRLNAGKARLEASGNVSLDSIAEIAETGVDYISAGAITKHVRAIDLSLLFDLE